MKLPEKKNDGSCGDFIYDKGYNQAINDCTKAIAESLPSKDELDKILVDNTLTKEVGGDCSVRFIHNDERRLIYDAIDKLYRDKLGVKER